MTPIAAFNTAALKYRGDGSTVTITGCVGGPQECPATIVIPNALGGLPVTRVGGEAFASDTVTSLTIAKTVTSIGDGAFSGATRLTQDYYRGNEPTVGTAIQAGSNAGLVSYQFAGTSGWPTPRTR